MLLKRNKKIIDSYSTGVTANISEPEELAELITNLLDDKKMLESFHNNCIIAAETLNWEKEKDKLLSIFKSL